jgi:hypothetical protein
VDNEAKTKRVITAARQKIEADDAITKYNTGEIAGDWAVLHDNAAAADEELRAAVKELDEG